jgi:Cu/Ag efflux pump CusA
MTRDLDVVVDHGPELPAGAQLRRRNRTDAASSGAHQDRVILASALVTLTLAPALRDRLLRGRVIPELGNPLTRGLVRLYRPFVQFALARPALTLTAAALARLSCLLIVGRLGGEYLPSIDEGDGRRS